MATHPIAGTSDRERDVSKTRAANLRTGAVLFSIALVFFVGVIVSKWMGGYAMGMSFVGLGILIFLVFAIARNLKSGN